jgi:hypothetical protein
MGTNDLKGGDLDAVDAIIHRIRGFTLELKATG